MYMYRYRSTRWEPVDSGEHDEAAVTQTLSRVHAAGTGMDWYYGAASERKASITEYQPNMNNANQVDSVTDRSVDSGEVNEEDLDSEEEEQKASEKHLNQYAPRRVVPHHPAAVSKKSSPMKLNLSFLNTEISLPPDHTPTSRTERERAAVAEAVAKLENSIPNDPFRRTPPSDYLARVGKHGGYDDDDDDDDADLFSPDLTNFNGERSATNDQRALVCTLTRPLASPRDSIPASPRDSIDAFKARWSPRNPHVTVTHGDVDPVLQRAERAMGILDAFISRSSSRDREISAENLSQHWAIVHDQYEVVKARTARLSQRPPSSKDRARHKFSEGGGGRRGERGGEGGEEGGGSDADASSLSNSLPYDSDSPSKSKSLIAQEGACSRDWQESSSTPLTPGPGTLANTIASAPTDMCGRRKGASPSSWTPSWMLLFSPALSQQDTPSGITGKET